MSHLKKSEHYQLKVKQQKETQNGFFCAINFIQNSSSYAFKF